MKALLQSSLAFFFLSIVAACESPIPDGIQSARIAMIDSIKAEPPGDYFVGRRYYKQDYKFWGFIRQPGQPWSTAKLVMLNEQQKLAPDRAAQLRIQALRPLLRRDRLRTVEQWILPRIRPVGIRVAQRNARANLPYGRCHGSRPPGDRFALLIL
jgi:hypothetical protein